MSYGSPIRDNYRRAAIYVDRILHGANPSDLPAEAPAEYDLVINRKIAADLGLEVPPPLSRRATLI
jgi:putative ABC transport system substrate-binding protein